MRVNRRNLLEKMLKFSATAALSPAIFSLLENGDTYILMQLDFEDYARSPADGCIQN